MPDEGRIQEPATQADDTMAAPRKRQTGVYVRGIVIAGIVVLAISGAGRWAYWQWSHVSETDARITADTVAISSRVAGWIVALPVADGELTMDERDLLLCLIRDERPPDRLRTRAALTAAKR